MSRKIVAFCEKCLFPVEFSEESGIAEKVCGCGAKVVPVRTDTFSKEFVEICPICGLAYFYIDKAFPHRFGLYIILGAIVGYFVIENYFPGMGIFLLVGIGIVDFLLFFLVHEKTVCYKCLTEFRRFKRNPKHGRFELGIAERLHGAKKKGKKGSL